MTCNLEPRKHSILLKQIEFVEFKMNNEHLKMLVKLFNSQLVLKIRVWV